MSVPEALTVEPGYGQPNQGYPDVVKVPSPAAGAGWTFTVPGGLAFQPVTIRQRLATSAAVANRVPRLNYADQDGLDFARVSANQNQPASDSQVYTAIVGLGTTYNQLSAAVVFPLPDCLLLPGWQISCVVNAIDAADQLSEIRMYGRQWPVGRSGYPLGIAPEDLDEMLQGLG